MTDGQTDGRAIAYTRYSVYAVARKNDCILLDDLYMTSLITEGNSKRGHMTVSDR